MRSGSGSSSPATIRRTSSPPATSGPSVRNSSSKTESASSPRLSVEQGRQLNDLLRGLEGTLTHPRGLPGREWYKHLIYAPGLLTGYGVKTLPGVRESIESDHFDEANDYSTATAAALTALVTPCR